MLLLRHRDEVQFTVQLSAKIAWMTAFGWQTHSDPYLGNFYEKLYL